MHHKVNLSCPSVLSWIFCVEKMNAICECDALTKTAHRCRMWCYFSLTSPFISVLLTHGVIVLCNCLWPMTPGDVFHWSPSLPSVPCRALPHRQVSERHSFPVWWQSVARLCGGRWQKGCQSQCGDRPHVTHRWFIGSHSALAAAQALSGHL